MIIIKVIGVAWLIVHYDSFISIFNDILKDYRRIILIPKQIVSCLMCSSLWVSIIFTNGDIPVSGFISLIAYLIDKYLITTEVKL